jgi:transcriptional regulator with XRE-family HTH domain
MRRINHYLLVNRCGSLRCRCRLSGDRKSLRPMNFSDSLKRYRREKELSQEEFAALLSVDVRTVGRWERGISLPNAVTYARVTNILRPRCGIDRQLRQFIASAHGMIQLFLPSTKMLAASTEFQRLQRMSASEVVGLYDVNDFPAELIEEHERLGGIETVFRNAQQSAGLHRWYATAPTNRTGRDILLRFQSQRIILDDDSIAILSTSEMVPKAEGIAFEVVW